MGFPAAPPLPASIGQPSVPELPKTGSNPGAAKAVAQQFGALLMQQMMQQSDGSAMAMTEGTGGGIVNSMFATMMGKTVAAGEKMGLTDLLLHSIEKKQGVQGQTGDTTAAAPPTAAGGGLARAAGFALDGYWAGNGHRPLAMAAPGAAGAAGAAPHGVPAPIGGAGLMLSPYARTASLVLPHVAPPAALPPPTSSDPDIANFTAQVAPLVQQAAQQLGVSPRILLAQTAIETGWGRSIVGNNLFGIKAGGSWPGAKVTAATHEYTDGQLVKINDAFRAYPDFAASVQDFVALVSKSPRYQAALGKGDDATGYAQALISGGWATDIDYVRKLSAVAAGSRATSAFQPTALVPKTFATTPL